MFKGPSPGCGVWFLGFFRVVLWILQVSLGNFGLVNLEWFYFNSQVMCDHRSFKSFLDVLLCSDMQRLGQRLEKRKYILASNMHVLGSEAHLSTFLGGEKQKQEKNNIYRCLKTQEE